MLCYILGEYTDLQYEMWVTFYLPVNECYGIDLLLMSLSWLKGKNLLLSCCFIHVVYI